MSSGCLLDTSFFIRLLNNEDPLHKNAKSYYKYLLENNYILRISTISIAEYCVRGTVDELPLKNLQVLPFNIDHAKRAGEFTQIILKNRSDLKTERKIVINDLKLFAQADLDETLQFYITCDSESQKIYDKLKMDKNVNFKFTDFRTPYNEVFGLLGLET